MSIPSTPAEFRASDVVQSNAALAARLFDEHDATEHGGENETGSALEACAQLRKRVLELDYGLVYPRTRKPARTTRQSFEGNGHALASLAQPLVPVASERSVQSRETTAPGLNETRRDVRKIGPLISAELLESEALSSALALANRRPKIEHAQWKLYRVVSGHLGWVRSVAVDASNEWFASGSADRTIKVWDMACGKLKLTLAGHIGTVRALACSERHPYLFSAGDDKMVKCWDLETNRVVRHFHGHLSGVYSMALHPSLDVLATAGRDAAVRVWDIRTRTEILTLGGHREQVNGLIAQREEPELISASADATVRLWDLAAAKTRTTLTHHRKGVRALARHPALFTFVSSSADQTKTWSLPRGELLRNFETGGEIINALAVNADGVLVSGSDKGQLRFFDYMSAKQFQEWRCPAQSGSLDAEASVFATAFDMSGTRLITGEGDSSIKMFRQV
ncbi:Pre-mRNA-splicing factor prp5 [Porphyridium purpureum]|uniref:Pre-mRNA-splicing factor prp5 n=1 Tax=Porphyridium purpureum TaxID=35688 RepID=A0A5J4Z2S6_PORPP|nr:Pre-mRNA-splicing factor prp5 [Porphyridium purpureum]|eukprot:POR4589..scf208_2